MEQLMLLQVEKGKEKLSTLFPQGHALTSKIFVEHSLALDQYILEYTKRRQNLGMGKERREIYV